MLIQKTLLSTGLKISDIVTAPQGIVNSTISIQNTDTSTFGSIFSYIS